MVEIGHGGVGFAFDSEGPRHRVLTEPFRLADRLMTNAEWMEFIEDGGYTKPLLRLPEGWAKAPAEVWSRPLYWETRDGQHWTTTLRGSQLVDPTRQSCMSATSRLMHSPRAPESGCRARAQRLDVDGNLGPNPRPHRKLGCSRCSATSGSGCPAHSRLTCAFARSTARSASTTASSCPACSFCEAALA
jgi:hypothetical protein